MTRHQQPVNKTPVHPVEPVLGTTLIEECWINDQEQGQDIADILGTTSYDGYVRTPSNNTVLHCVPMDLRIILRINFCVCYGRRMK